ncbi:hypothetical protein Ssed_3766 [Shewanella sediminis HAW-EB3]|uniref:Uncharacterized protein n=1 Tax=Shewanella sediminis (strain HAW-EB3) TaxID=425104 RepID=A8FZU7_SHESH|nr:hypothetical protein Ssed_3766 [Shewanella sediminis HAW-EB3]
MGAQALQLQITYEAPILSQSNNTGHEQSGNKGSTFETKMSFGLGMITLLLIFGYFYESFQEIQRQEIIVIAIDRIEAASDAKKD